MQIAYAYRRGTFYPYHGMELAPRELRPRYWRKVKAMGFDGVELPVMAEPGRSSEETARELRAELADAGLVCAAVRGGGGLHHPRVAAQNRRRLEEAIRFAAAAGARIVNSIMGGPLPYPQRPGTGYGEPVTQLGSRIASEAEYERTARGLQELAARAADAGVELSIEVHQHSLVDNSWSALHLLELVDRPNVGVNPDLGNIYWCYDVPEESCEAAIVALAPKAKYWHCKNLRRVHIPDLQKAIFLQVPLPDGEIDYRFAIQAMLDAGYQGYLAVEGLRLGDQYHGDARSVAYVRQLLDELERKA